MSPADIRKLCEHLKAARDELIKARSLILDHGSMADAAMFTDWIGHLHSRIVMLGGTP